MGTSLRAGLPQRLPTSLVSVRNHSKRTQHHAISSCAGKPACLTSFRVLVLAHAGLARPHLLPGLFYLSPAPGLIAAID